MQKEWKALLKADLYRYYDKIPFLKPPQIKYLMIYRKASAYSKDSIRGIWLRLRLKRMSEKTMIQIPTESQIGAGFYIGHFGRILIHPEAIIGENVNIATGVTIGRDTRGSRRGAPHIGSCVWIGTNAVLVGNITIGDDVLIAPGAFVNMDVPSHSIVIGNPATIHTKENATEGYINRKVNVKEASVE